MPVVDPVFHIAPGAGDMPRVLRTLISAPGGGAPAPPKTVGVLWPIQRPAAGG